LAAAASAEQCGEAENQAKYSNFRAGFPCHDRFLFGCSGPSAGCEV
jgi:hypothetical protein